MENPSSEPFDPMAIDRQLICEGWGEHLTLASTKKRDVKRLYRRTLYEKSLIDFGKAAWPIIEPGREFISGHHIDAMCEHLQAVTRGEINRLVLNVPPGTGKPIAEDELVTTSMGRVPLKDIAVGDRVLGKDGLFHEVTQVHNQGLLPVVCITTQSGRTVKAAHDHPFWTTEGWVAAGDLTSADTLALVVQQEWPGIPMDSREARLLGYLVGDGSTKYGNTTFTNANEQILDDACHCGSYLGFGHRRTQKQGCTHTYAICFSTYKGSRSGGTGRRGLLREWRTRHGLDGKSSYTKRIPEEVMNADMFSLASFLGAYWSCDGYVAVRHSNQNKTSFISEATTVSEHLAHDIQHALLRLGIASRIRKKTSNITTKRQGGDKYISWNVIACSQHDVCSIAKLPGLCTEKKNRTSIGKTREFDRVLIPDAIVSVEEAGYANCRCLTVEGGTFTANDFAVHNSLWVSALWPCWSWTNDPFSRWLFASYSSNNTVRDSRKRRELIKSPWFRNFWWGWRLKDDQDTAHHFENSKQGFMLATSTGSGSTGTHAGYLVYDDPHDRMDRYSKVKREEAINWYKTVFTSLNLGPDTRYVIVAQRITEDDMTGYVLANELGYEHLCIPLTYDSQHPHANKTTCLGWRDWRTKDGEVMWPEMFPPATLENLKKEKSSYDLAAQYQQNPTRDEGAMFPRSNFLYFKSEGYGDDEVLTLYQRDGSERHVLAAQCQWFQCADTALETTDSSAWTVVGTFLITPQPAAMLVYDIARERLSVPKQYGFLVTQRARFPRVTAQYVEKKASGHGLIQEGAMRGNVFGALKAQGSKDMRLVPASIQYENGVVYHRMASQASWLAVFENEMAGVPDTEYRDQSDTVAYAGMMFQRYWITDAYSHQSIAYVPGKGDSSGGPEAPSLPQQTRRLSLAEQLTGRRTGGNE